MYSSIIFQTFDSDISKTISKIGVFGKSFNEIFTLIKQRSVEIKDLKKSGVNPDEAKEQVGGLLSYVFKDEYKDGLVKEFESFMGEMNKTGKNAHELASELGSELNPAIRSFVESSSSGKITVEGFRKSIGNLSIGAKAGEVAMKGLTLAGNVLVSFLISQAIEGCIKLYRLSKDVAASANEVGSSFLSEKGSIESYKKQIAELYDTINDSSSSFEDVTNAREKLMDVQNELIDNFGTERSTIEHVTNAINGQVSALDKLSASKWQESENDFNKGGFWNTVGNFFAGYKNNIARMEKEYGNYSANLSFGSILGSDKRSEAANLLKAYGVSFNDAGLGMIKLSGNATEVYNQLISIQSLIKDVGADFGDSFNNELTSYINNAKDMSDQYEDFYNQYVLYNKVLSNGSQYSDAYKRIIDAKKSYDEAIKSGDKSSQNAAAQEYASAITEGSKLALENNESDVSNYFKSMYPELKQIVSEWTFELDFKVDKEGLKDDLKNYLNAFEGFSTEDLLKFNPAGGTDAQKLSYANMEKLADDYGMTFSELVKELENEKLIFSEAYHNLSNIFGEENISSLPEEDFTYALKIDVSEANKTLDAEEKRIATKIKQMSNLGNVDLTISPHVDENDMKNAGWDSNVADTSFGGKFVKQKDESGNDEYVYIHYTPVLPDGTILSPEQMSEYIQKTLNGSQNILDADDKGLVVKVDTEVPSSEDVEDFIDTGKMSDSMRLFLLQMNNWDVSCKKVRDDYSGINTACGYVNTTLQNMIAKQKSAEEFVPSTKQQMIENIDSLSEGFEELDKIMASMKDESPFDYSLLDDKKFKEAFSGCGEAYTDFIEKISSTPNDVSACQSAFNNLVTEWINSSGVMDGLSEDTAQLTEDMLTNMGITNAHEVVTALLAQKQFELGAANEYAAATGGDLASATDAEIAAYGAELAVQGQLTQQTAQFLLQKIKNNGITINTAADIDNIYALAQAAGATAGTLDALTAAKNRFGTNSSGSSYTDRLRARKDAFFAFKYGDKNKESEYKYEIPKYEYGGGSNTNKSSGGSNSETDKYLENFEKMQDKLKDLYDQGKITTKQYYDEAYWDEIIKGMEETKTKWEELQELQENVELEMNLRSLGYEGGIDEVLALTDEQFAEFKNKYLQYIAGMNQGNQSFIDSLSQISGVDIGNLPDIFKETQEYIDMLGQGIDFTALDSSLGGVIDGFTEIANNAKLATGAVIGGAATTSANSGSSGNKNGAQGGNGQSSSGSGDSFNDGIKTMSEESVPKINEVANAFAGSEEGEDTGTSVAGSAQKASKAISSGKDSGGEEDESLQGAIKTQVEAAVDEEEGIPKQTQAWDGLNEILGKIKTNLNDIKTLINEIANMDLSGLSAIGGIQIGGGAGVDGTAFASGTLGKVSDNGVALGGELGREMVVRDGRFFTVGDNGAELFHHKKGDIIFNHKQTQDILKNGHTNSRGKAFAGGNVSSLPKEYSLPSQEVMDRMAKLEAGFNSLNRDESLLVQMQIRDNTKKIYEQNARAIQEVQKYNKSNSTSNTYNYSIDAIELPNVMNGEDFYRDIRRLNTLIKQQSNTRK